jgi:hypothetical protein
LAAPPILENREIGRAAAAADRFDHSSKRRMPPTTIDADGKRLSASLSTV